MRRECLCENKEAEYERKPFIPLPLGRLRPRHGRTCGEQPVCPPSFQLVCKLEHKTFDGIIAN